jgi:hypothetical protein
LIAWYPPCRDAVLEVNVFQTVSMCRLAAVFWVLGLWACSPGRKPGNLVDKALPDSVQGIRLPKEAPGFEIHSIQKSRGDTLHRVTCSEFVYRPFGPLSNLGDLPKSRLNPKSAMGFSNA